jgi:hypothetical protein
MMHALVVGLVLTVSVATSAQAQRWQLTTITKGDSMYTDLDRVEQVGPHVYRAWSKYVYLKRQNGNSDAQALVQKEYDCRQGNRRVLFAVFYNADHAVTWESKQPGPWTPVTRQRGGRQWLQVCNRVEGGVLSNFTRWLTSKL